jgi:hypothetical protein
MDRIKDTITGDAYETHRHTGSNVISLVDWFIPVAPTWSICHPWIFVSLQFLNLRHSVGFLGRVIRSSQGRYLTQTQNEHRHPTIPRVRFEPTISASERSKIVHALDRPATVIGSDLVSRLLFSRNKERRLKWKRWKGESEISAELLSEYLKGRDYCGEPTADCGTIPELMLNT